MGDGSCQAVVVLGVRIGGRRSRKPRLHDLSELFGHMLCRLLLLEVDALLFGPKSGQTVQVQGSGLELLYQLGDEDSRPGVIEGKDEDVASVGDAT